MEQALLSLKSKKCMMILLTQLEVKILFDDSTYNEDDGTVEADTMIDAA